MNEKHLSVEGNEQSAAVKLKTKKHTTFILPTNFILASFGTLDQELLSQYPG